MINPSSVDSKVVLPVAAQAPGVGEGGRGVAVGAVVPGPRVGEGAEGEVAEGPWSVAEGIGVRVAVRDGVRLGVRVRVRVGTGLAVAVDVAVGDDVTVGVSVGVAVGVSVGLDVAVGVRLAVGVAVSGGNGWKAVAMGREVMTTVTSPGEAKVGGGVSVQKYSSTP